MRSDNELAEQPYISDKDGFTVDREVPPDFKGDWPFQYMQPGDSIVFQFTTGLDFATFKRARAAAQAYSERTGVKITASKQGSFKQGLQQRFLTRGADVAEDVADERNALLDTVVRSSDGQAVGAMRGTLALRELGDRTPWPFKYMETGDYVEFDAVQHAVLARKARGYAHTYAKGTGKAFKTALRGGTLKITRVR